MSAELEVEAATAEPFGDVGAKADRPTRPGHDPATGRFVRGNREALVVGEFSAAFWREHEQARRERGRAMLRDRGHTEADAPQALLDAVDGAVQAVMLRDSAFLHVAASGGPATLRGRRRAAFKVWCEASDRAERYLRLVGLERKARPVMDLAQAFAEHERGGARG